MKEYMKVGDLFKLGVGFPASASDLQVVVATHAINVHDELVSEVERLHQVLKRCCDALYIADKFCGNHTADECDDSIAIPIKDALVESAAELTK